ncbi:hypothetical protein [Chitinophaga caeni]|uniref:hypothetical protein n=1 Tax=Chitinophaga caeni TaxID=2029983 RepID=UPI0012FE5EEA|nr:hypothetical protein [Chitinophaga caeni]
MKVNGRRKTFSYFLTWLLASTLQISHTLSIRTLMTESYLDSFEKAVKKEYSQELVVFNDR